MNTLKDEPIHDVTELAYQFMYDLDNLGRVATDDEFKALMTKYQGVGNGQGSIVFPDRSAVRYNPRWQCMELHYV